MANLHSVHHTVKQALAADAVLSDLAGSGTELGGICKAIMAILVPTGRGVGDAMKFSELIIGVAGAGTVLLGAYCVYAEAAPIARGGDHAFERLERMANGHEPIGISGLSQNFALRDCNTALAGYRGLSMRLQDDAFQARLPGLCAEIAEQVLTRTPASGLAELVLAEIAAHNNDFAELDARLRASQALSPGEGHLAAARTALAEANIDAMSADGLERHQSDLLLLMRAGRNIWHVAQLYVDSEAARVRIAAALKLMTPDEQAHFLGAVRRLLDLQGNS